MAIAAVAAALTLLPAASPAFAAEPIASAADQNCLACHGTAGMEKKLSDGDTLQLHVAAGPYLQSVHGANGCTSCHADVDITKHPPEKNDIAGKRSFALAMTQVCKTCHADKFEQWQSSIHAALVRSGNPNAPVCTDCHNPHAVIKGRGDAASIRFPARSATPTSTPPISAACMRNPGSLPKDSYAPICSGCHTAHSVQADLGRRLRARVRSGACFGCHADVLEAHQKWLPNAALHFEVVSCPACHVPGAQRTRRSHADRQQRQGARNRTNRRAAVRRQHQIGRQGHRCAGAV